MKTFLCFEADITPSNLMLKKFLELCKTRFSSCSFSSLVGNM